MFLGDGKVVIFHWFSPHGLNPVLPLLHCPVLGSGVELATNGSVTTAPTFAITLKTSPCVA